MTVAARHIGSYPRAGWVRERRGISDFQLLPYLKVVNKTPLDVVATYGIRQKSLTKYAEANEYPLAMVLRMFEDWGDGGVTLGEPRTMEREARLPRDFEPWINVGPQVTNHANVVPIERHLRPDDANAFRTIIGIVPQLLELVRQPRTEVQGYEDALRWQAAAFADTAASLKLAQGEIARLTTELRRVEADYQAAQELLDRQASAVANAPAPSTAAAPILARVHRDHPLLEQYFPKVEGTPFFDYTNRAEKALEGLPEHERSLLGTKATQFTCISPVDRMRALTRRPDLDRSYHEEVRLLRVGSQYVVLTHGGERWKVLDILARKDHRAFRNER